MNRNVNIKMNMTDMYLDKTIKDCFDTGPMPAEVQIRMHRTYESFSGIPQEPHIRKRRMHRGGIVIAAAVACMLFGGVAVATTNMIQMGSGTAPFFEADRNLPVFSSMEAGAKALSAEVNQEAMIDGMHVSFDSISCDRNVANLYMTLSRDGGFDLDSLSVYNDSRENEWVRLQRVTPRLGYALIGDDGVRHNGNVRNLDAYLEGGNIKCLMRITPEETMPDKVTISIGTWSQDIENTAAFNVGLDLSNIPAPRELGSQKITFDTSQGSKTLDLRRFTVSELATVMVAKNNETRWTDDDGRTVSGLTDEYIHPRDVKVTDDKGNILQSVESGDNLGHGMGEAYVIEFAGITSDSHSVTFTPVLTNDEAIEAQRQKRIEMIENGQEWEAEYAEVDVSQSGSKIPLSPLGGYELKDCVIKDSTVTIRLKPYGWTPNVPELITNEDVPMLAEEWIDPETGQRKVGYHSAIRYNKWDYSTGEVIQIDSYYNATDEALEAIHNYRCHIYPDWFFIEDLNAARTLSFV